MQGQILSRVTLRRKNLRTPFPPGMEKTLQGRRVEKVERRAKYILAYLSGGKTLLAHLGMSGRMALSKANAPLGKHDHVVFDLKNKRRIVFHDPRRFGLMDIADTKDLHKHKLLRGIGPEPLGKALSAAYLEKILKGKKPAIKIAIMDQRLIAGIGNIYACEALFYARIDPRKAAGKVSKAELGRLVPAIKNVLNKSIALGGSSLRDYTHADGKLGSFQNNFAVYGCEGKACRVRGCSCVSAGGIRCITQAGRSTFFCPVQQK
jgi:formamidopyrimidine-DNA glycosylase